MVKNVMMDSLLKVEMAALSYVKFKKVGFVVPRIREQLADAREFYPSDNLFY